MPRVRALVLASHVSRDELTAIAGAGAPHAMRVGNQPLVSFGIRAARAAGIDEVAVMVCRDTKGPVRAALGASGGRDLVWIETAEPLGFTDSLLAAADFLGTAPFLVHAGDAIVLDALGPLVQELSAGGTDALMLAADTRTADRQALWDVDGWAAALGGGDSLAGTHLLGSRALELAAAAGKPSGSRGPAALAAAIAQGGGRVRTRLVRCSWTYKGTIDHVLEANRMVLDELGRERPAAVGDDVRIEGRVAVHPSASLERTTVRGPAVIGRGAVVRDSFIGPYSAIGDGAMIEGAELEHSIVLAGATIRHPGRRLEASLVGEGATVRRDFGLPSSLRVRVGERTEVRLA